MKRARRLIAIAVVGVLAAGCGDSAPVVAPTPAPSAAPSFATSGPTVPDPPSDAGPAASPSGSAVQTNPGPSPASGSDWRALRWTGPVSISATAAPFDILLFAGSYVVVGTDGDRTTAWTSPDFATWTPASVDGLPLADAAIGSPLAGPDGLLSLGVHGRLHCGTGEGATCDPLPVAIWTSPDGRSWHGRAAPPVFAGATIARFGAGPGGLVAVGDTGWDHPAIWFSADGVAWRKESLRSTIFRHAMFFGLTAFRGGWVLTGQTNPIQEFCCGGADDSKMKAAAWFSADGRTWSRASVESPARESMGDAYAGSDGLVSGGFDVIWVSTDGQSWRIGPSKPDIAPVASDGERIIAVSQEVDNGLGLWVSSDGRSWQALADAGSASAKPAWNSTTGSPDSFRLLPRGLAILGTDGEDATSPMWLATPTGFP
jgi:hypothetical protein